MSDDIKVGDVYDINLIDDENIWPLAEGTEVIFNRETGEWDDVEEDTTKKFSRP